MGLRITVAGLRDVAAIVELEDLAGRIYAEAGLPADLPGLTPGEVEHAIASQTVWTLRTSEDLIVAFALCTAHPDALHLRELDVAPAWMRRGLGRRLVEHVVERASVRHVPVTLTTFRDVPWNAPLYRRYGFRLLPASEQPPWLAEICRAERAGPLGAWPRVAMIRAPTCSV
ncbi:MAG: GNAT family N-acetyltransferase [Myxococcales bacterium FL481]|nr:MAG: GNAT family N-acetyltransferase [Myxococcales bacterium FL481]